MGDPKAFLNIPRQEAGYRPISERITDYSQVEQTLNTNSRNGRTHYTKENGKKRMKFYPQPATFRNLPDVYALPFAKSPVC